MNRHFYISDKGEAPQFYLSMIEPNEMYAGLCVRLVTVDGRETEMHQNPLG